jgi:CubicO group peptidase (beta-lactamase class C family)
MKHAILAAALALAACATPAPASGPPVITDPVAAGWNVSALADVAAYAESQKTTGFLIIRNRKIIYEHNWPLPADAETFRANFTHGTAPSGALLEDVASQQKSFVAMLAAVAIDKGELDISKTVTSYLGAGWSKASPEQEAAITVRNLMEMNSGLTEQLTYEKPAGSAFFYNTPAYAIMKPVLEAASHQTLDAITHDWLTEPAGMADSGWRQRPAVFADVGNPTGLVTTPRDTAIFGQIVLDGGLAASGKRIVSKQQIDAMFTRTATNPAYGHLWWLNGGSYALSPGAKVPRTDGQLIPAAPADLVAALGAMDRKLYIVPSRNLIVVRMGQAAPDRDFNQQLWTRIMKAAPK